MKTWTNTETGEIEGHEWDKPDTIEKYDDEKHDFFPKQ